MPKAAQGCFLEEHIRRLVCDSSDSESLIRAVTISCTFWWTRPSDFYVPGSESFWSGAGSLQDHWQIPVLFADISAVTRVCIPGKQQNTYLAKSHTKNNGASRKSRARWRGKTYGTGSKASPRIITVLMRNCSTMRAPRIFVRNNLLESLYPYTWDWSLFGKPWSLNILF